MGLVLLNLCDLLGLAFGTQQEICIYLLVLFPPLACLKSDSWVEKLCLGKGQAQVGSGEVHHHHPFSWLPFPSRTKYQLGEN